MKTILLIEDDKNLNRGISLKLTKEGYHVCSAEGVAAARKYFKEDKIDLIISDVMLEDGNGLDFCKEVRESSDVYIIFLTALDSEVDMVAAYDIGADDYMAKPFSLMVLVSKVHAVMRRVEGKTKDEIHSGDIRILPSEMKAWKGQELLTLSKREMQLLLYLMENSQQIVSKEQILEHVWDVDGQFVDENTVPVNISRLRAKVGEDMIQTVRGMGYIWTKEGMLDS